MTESTVDHHPVVKSVLLDIRYADDELALSDLMLDLDDLLSAIDNNTLSGWDHDETTPALLRQIIEAINTGWTAAGHTRREASA